MRPFRGFSLIEMFIVIAIFGVIAAIALPSISAMTARRAASSEVEKVKGALDFARDSARAKLRCMRVTNPTTSSLLIEELAAATNGCGVTVTTSTTKQFRVASVSLPNAISLTFDRSGALTGTTAATVPITVNGVFPGGTVPHTFLIFRILGLVRK